MTFYIAAAVCAAGFSQLEVLQPTASPQLSASALGSVR